MKNFIHKVPDVFKQNFSRKLLIWKCRVILIFNSLFQKHQTLQEKTHIVKSFHTFWNLLSSSWHFLAFDFFFRLICFLLLDRLMGMICFLSCLLIKLTSCRAFPTRLRLDLQSFLTTLSWSCVGSFYSLWFGWSLSLVNDFRVVCSLIYYLIKLVIWCVVVGVGSRCELLRCLND